MGTQLVAHESTTILERQLKDTYYGIHRANEIPLAQGVHQVYKGAFI